MTVALHDLLHCVSAAKAWSYLSMSEDSSGCKDWHGRDMVMRVVKATPKSVLHMLELLPQSWGLCEFASMRAVIGSFSTTKIDCISLRLLVRSNVVSDFVMLSLVSVAA
jgi:hypothetical protein